MQQHFILCGLGKIGWGVLEQLRGVGAPIIAVDNRCSPDDPRLGSIPLVVGDCRQPEVLARARLEHARGVVIATSDDLVSLSTALLVRQLHPTIRIVVRLFNQSLLARLGPAVGNMHALSTSALVAPLLGLIARTGETSAVVDLGQGRRQQLAQLTIGADSPLVGRRLDDLAQQYAVAVVGHQPAGQSLRFRHDITPEDRAAAGDRLVLCGPPEKVAPLLSPDARDAIPDLLWAGTPKRVLRVVLRGIALVDWPVKVCAAVFFTVIVGSVLVFRFGMDHDYTIDAFYRTIALLATGADMHGDELERGSWQKAFISGLRLIGTALTAAFTAIFANYLIRANLKGALEVRRIPESGHIIVCGLGNVGFRVVEDLLEQGEQVVALEANANNPFIPTARRLGAAVIVGNATLIQVLRQAHAATARAVVATTSNDLVNLEIALQVRELAPRQRVVLRLIDAQLASTLRHSANVRLAVSIPELAAPAFVAALYGDRVRGIFRVDGKSLAVYELIVPDDEATGNGDARGRAATVGDFASAFQLVPLGLSTDAGEPKAAMENERLAAGDRLTVLVTLDKLQQLVQRDGIRSKSDQSITSKA
jgi:Trk K+ transport system NAD-binding subunit